MFKGKEHAMRPHQLGNRRNVIILSLLASFILGAIFVFAPMSSIAAPRQALAKTLSPSPAGPVTTSVFADAHRYYRGVFDWNRPLPWLDVAKITGEGETKASGSFITVGAMVFAGATLVASPPSGTTVAPGSNITYTITINNGFCTDTNTFIQTQTPLNTTFVSAAITDNPTAWTITAQPIVGGTGLVRWDGPGGIGSLPADDSITVTLTVKVNPAASDGFVIAFSGNYGAQFGEDGLGCVFLVGDNVPFSASHTVAVTFADLSLTKFAGAGGGGGGGTVVAGGTSAAFGRPGSGTPANGTGNITYELLIGNGGPNDGTNTIIQDSIPNNTVLVSNPALDPTTVAVNGFPQPAFVMNCNVFGGNFIECRPGNNTGLNPAWGPDVLPNGFTARLRYRVRVPADVAQGTIIQNEARISSVATNPGPGTLTADPNAGNNASTPVNTLVIALADLGITKVTSNPTPTAGGAAFSYTLVVTNNGPSNAIDVVVNDPLPPGVIFQNVAVVNATGGNLVCVGPPNATNGTVSCTSGNFPAGSVSTVTIVAQIVSNVASGVRTNTATVGSATTETPNVAPNSASVQQNIVVDAPLSITKAGPATVCAGDTYTYHITVLNGGSSTALNATISDPLPANTTFLSQVGTGAFAGTCSHNGGIPGTVTCGAVDIPSGLSTLDITVKLAPNAPVGALANTATI
ncbi:MAG: hypothetical protein ABI882_18525, partial [Acidobacteriota bacterium]